MRIFQVRQAKTGAILCTGEASDAARAIDVMAIAAGYHSASELPAEVSEGGLKVEALHEDA